MTTDNPTTPPAPPKSHPGREAVETVLGWCFDEHHYCDADGNTSESIEATTARAYLAALEARCERAEYEADFCQRVVTGNTKPVAPLTLHIASSYGIHRLCERLRTDRDSLRQRCDQLEGDAMCDVCVGRGKLESGRKCMCGGTGKAIDGVAHLRQRLASLERVVEAAKEWADAYENTPSDPYPMEGSRQRLDLLAAVRALGGSE